MDKPRLVEVTDHHELAKLWEERGQLGTPHMFGMPTQDKWGNGVWCEVHELEAWRSQSQSEGGK